MQMSQRGLELLKQWEGFKNSVYLDSGGKETIGVGHLLTAVERASGTLMIGGQAVAWRNGLTNDQVLDLLKQDVAVYERAVNNDVKVALQQNQFDALVSFTFNEGTGSFATSTLLKDINQGDLADVPNQFRRWNKVNGQVSQGLVNRRANEIRLWSGELGDTAPAPANPSPSNPASPTPTAPTPTAPTPAPQPNPGATARPTTYTVAAGDTLALVAAKFNTTVADIADTNDIINPADFTVGRVIRLPNAAS